MMDDERWTGELHWDDAMIVQLGGPGGLRRMEVDLVLYVNCKEDDEKKGYPPLIDCCVIKSFYVLKSSDLDLKRTVIQGHSRVILR
jgi:hypothetical protein